MPQLLLIVLVGVAGWLVWRAVRRERERIAAKLREADAADKPTRLEKDPATGVYRPVDRR